MEPTGLLNRGNTCYCNAILQILAHTPRLHPLEGEEFNADTGREWTAATLALRGCTPGMVIDPTNFLDAMFKSPHNPFVKGAQNDMAEFFIYLVDQLHESIAPTEVADSIAADKDAFGTARKDYCKKFTRLRYLFHGITASPISDKGSGELLSSPAQIFSTLSLPITGPSLQQCLLDFMAPEELSGYRNEKTGALVDAERRLFFYHLPMVLVIDLKRFDCMGAKDERRVAFPLDGLVVGGQSFHLYAVGCHLGNSMCGHCAAAVLCGTVWWACDDTTVRRMTQRQVTLLPAYMLFYTRR